MHHRRKWLQERPRYGCWDSMKQRCYNPKSPMYKNYGGRGIKVCDRWLHSYQSYIEDIGLPPTPKHSLDRIDNDGDYTPENVRWATQTEQNYNQRIRRDNKLGVRGVLYDKYRKSYRVHIWVNGKQGFVGRYKTLEEAKKARLQAEKNLLSS